jgi:putative thiamine transport system permease protein
VTAAAGPAPGALALAPALTALVLAGPVAAGLAGVAAPAFGWAPWIGRSGFSLDAWAGLLAWPGLGASVAVGLGAGLAATALSLAGALLIVAALHDTRAFAAIERALAPLLAIPHAAAAFGLAFLIEPSGWAARLVSPWATGWTRPPDALVVGDPLGLALVAGLVLKEIPFLLLMILAALPQADARRSVIAARAMGRGPVWAWLLTALPRVYPQIRLPVYATLAYGASTVEMATILGPAAPPTLAAQIVAWTRDADLAMGPRAASAALLLAAATVGLIALWRLGERAAGAAGLALALRGFRGGADGALRAAGIGAGAATLAGLAGGGVALALWSVAGRWRFPDAWPERLTASTWAGAAGLASAAWTTAAIGAVATAAALALAVGCLEAEHRHGLPPPRRALWLLWLPLIAPQAAFLPGLQALALATGLDGGFWPVAAAHVVFVAPYVYLALADPWRAWDRRAGLAAAALGAGPGRVLRAVRLPMLLAPLATAAAVGFAVSAGQYLPTVLIGGGRVTTLTTEAVALGSGGDRRLIGAWALAQAAAPLAAFAAALAIPAVLLRGRRGLRP